MSALWLLSDHFQLTLIGRIFQNESNLERDAQGNRTNLVRILGDD
jgi:hypothetical protein